MLLTEPLEAAVVMVSHKLELAIAKAHLLAFHVAPRVGGTGGLVHSKGSKGRVASSVQKLKIIPSGIHRED